MNPTIYLKNNTTVHTLWDPKFKEVYVSLRILFPMEKRTNTVAHVMSKLFDDRLVTHPTKAAMNERLDSMYGSRLSSRTYGIGSYQVLEINNLSIHEQYTGDALLSHQLDLVADVLFQPLINENTVQEAKRLVAHALKRSSEQPANHAIQSAFAKAGEHQYFGLSSQGELTDLESIHVDDMQAFHRLCVDVFAKELYLVGDVKDFDVSRFESGHSVAIQPAYSPTVIRADYVEEFYPGNQTELVLIYETDIDPDHPLYFAYLVFMAYFGQTPSSLLFDVIREQHSLCYSIHASQLIYDGVFFVSTGISDRNIAQLLQLVDEQIAAISDQPIAIESAKNYLALQLEGTTERHQSLADFAFRNQRLVRQDTLSDLQENIRSVTSAEVKEVTKHICKPFVYAYRGNLHEEN